jgi:hypothetical protein
MKADGTAFLEWLHKRRAAKELERQKLGLSEGEWLLRVHAEADRILAGLPGREQPSLARDRRR